eukprot:UN00193
MLLHITRIIIPYTSILFGLVMLMLLIPRIICLFFIIPMSTTIKIFFILLHHLSFCLPMLYWQELHILSRNY